MDINIFIDFIFHIIDSIIVPLLCGLAAIFMLWLKQLIAYEILKYKYKTEKQKRRNRRKNRHEKRPPVSSPR